MLYLVTTLHYHELFAARFQISHLGDVEVNTDQDALALDINVVDADLGGQIHLG